LTPMLILPIFLTAVRAALPIAEQGQSVESLALSAVPATSLEGEEEKRIDEWMGSFTAGLTFTDGNTKRKTASANLDLTKEYQNADRWSNNLYWNYAEEGGVRTQRRAGLKSQYDSSLDEKTYWYVNGSAQTDEQAGVDLRWTAGVGIGRIFRDDEEWRFAAEAGLSYLSEEFSDNTDNDYVAARVAYRANWHYSERLDLGQVTELFPSVEDSADVYGRMDTRAVYKLTGNMISQFQWVWDWDNTPAAGRDRSDHLFLVTVGWTF
ncbi:MAG: DUF481 domain-containing protein, partial [Planctomycetota bacterium]